MTLAWFTDLHLNLLGEEVVGQIADVVVSADVDSVVISGDIADASLLADCLERLADLCRVKVYFVLGNHDFFHGSIAGIRKSIDDLCARQTNLVYLSNAEGIRLSSDTLIVGHDSWADGQYGDYGRSDVELNDFYLIEELSGLSKAERLYQMQGLAREAVEHYRKILPEAIEAVEHVILVTHAPPYREACLYDGRISSDLYLPLFACKMTGDFLLDLMVGHVDKRMTVLCGHTHHHCEFSPLANLNVRVGAAEYCRPPHVTLVEYE